MKSTVKKTVQKPKGATKTKRLRVKDTGPKPVDDFITTDKQRKLADLLVLRAKEYCKMMELVEGDEKSNEGWEAFQRMDQGLSTDGFSREAITAGKTVKALEEAQEELVSSGVPFIVADELVGRVMGDDPEDIPYSIYKEFGRDF